MDLGIRPRKWVDLFIFLGLFLVMCRPTMVSAQTNESSKAGRNAISTSAEPQGTGVYYLASDEWRLLERNVNFKRQHRHCMPGAYFPFVTQQVLKFRGAEAAVKIQEARPRFLLKRVLGDRSPDDILLVRLEKEKHSRVLPVTSGRTIFQFRREVPKDHTSEIVVSAESNAALVVTPKVDLPPGEYMLTFGSGGKSTMPCILAELCSSLKKMIDGGYDFEVIAPDTPRHTEHVVISAIR